MILKMGTRGSPLALAQSGQLAKEFMRLRPEVVVETVVITTSGDRFSPQGLGAKGLFIKEIEEALLDGRVDFAVHSGKDLPAELAPGLLIAAYPQREDPRDVYIGGPTAPWAALGPGRRIGTSSLRRKIQLLTAKPGVEVLPLRGNVDTRMRRVQEGAFDGIILALAGLRRLGRADVPHEIIPETVIVPAPAQGALAVEAKADRADVLALLAVLDHPRTRLEVECERAFLEEFGGGCSIPLGSLVRAEETGLTLSAFWSEIDGSKPVRLSQACPDPGRAMDFAREMADRLRSAAA